MATRPRKSARLLYGEKIGLAVEEATAAWLEEMAPRAGWTVEWTAWCSLLDRKGIDYLFQKANRKFILAVDLKQDLNGEGLAYTFEGGVELDGRWIKRIVVWFDNPRCWRDYESKDGKISEMGEKEWEVDTKAIAEYVLDVIDEVYDSINKKPPKVRAASY